MPCAGVTPAPQGNRGHWVSRTAALANWHCVAQGVWCQQQCTKPPAGPVFVPKHTSCMLSPLHGQGTQDSWGTRAAYGQTQAAAFYHVKQDRKIAAFHNPQADHSGAAVPAACRDCRRSLIEGSLPGLCVLARRTTLLFVGRVQAPR